MIIFIIKCIILFIMQSEGQVEYQYLMDHLLMRIINNLPSRLWLGSLLRSRMTISIYVVFIYALVICMYAPPPPTPPAHPTPGTFHFGALESTGMSLNPGTNFSRKFTDPGTNFGWNFPYCWDKTLNLIIILVL